MKVALILAAAFVVSACRVTDPNEGARVKLLAHGPESDGIVNVTISNVGTRDIVYTGCPFALEFWNGSRWVETGWPEQPMVCTMQAPAGLAPGESGQLGVRLPTLGTGRYRLVFGDVRARTGTQLPYDQRATNPIQIGFMLG